MLKAFFLLLSFFVSKTMSNSVFSLGNFKEKFPYGNSYSYYISNRKLRELDATGGDYNRYLYATGGDYNRYLYATGGEYDDNNDDNDDNDDMSHSTSIITKPTIHILTTSPIDITTSIIDTTTSAINNQIISGSGNLFVSTFAPFFVMFVITYLL